MREANVDVALRFLAAVEQAYRRLMEQLVTPIPEERGVQTLGPPERTDLAPFRARVGLANDAALVFGRELSARRTSGDFRIGVSACGLADCCSTGGILLPSTPNLRGKGVSFTLARRDPPPERVLEARDMNALVP